MKLKEEWTETVKVRGKYNAGTYEIFVNPTAKEVRETESGKGIRWLADSKTKKVYIADLNLFHVEMLEGLKLIRKGSYNVLPHYESSRWLAGTKHGVRFSSDALTSSDADKKELEKMLKKDWSWTEKYLPGLNKFVKYERRDRGIKEGSVIKIDNILDRLLTESGIRIPKGTHAAKVIFHQDLDGIMSAILTVNQLVKQGIPKSKIRLSSIQYGDNKEEVKNKLSASKGQMVALVDFARIPKEGVRQPDFWSDHHEQPEEDKPKTDKDKKPLKTKTIKYGWAEKRKGFRTGKIKQIEKKVYVKEAIGKTEFPSEAGHLAKVHAQNLMTGKDIEAISKVDSASYTNLADIMDLPKNFRESGRMERLAIITNAMLSTIIRDNPTAINQLIIQSNPSVASVYSNLIKLIKLNNKQASAIKELSKANPNWELVKSVKKQLPSEMAKDVKGGPTKIKKATSLKDIRKGRQEQIATHTDPKKTSFKKGNDYVIIQSHQGRSQPQRFVGSLLTKQSGERYPAMMREWSTMFQISLNPSLSIGDKEKLDLTKGVDKILSDVIKDVNSGKIKVSDKGMTNWALTKVIRPEAGGHKGIATVGGLGTLGLAPKKIREELKILYGYKDRVKKLKGKRKMEDIMPKSAEKMKRYLEIKKEFAKEREMIVGEIKKRILDGIEKSMKAKNIQAPKGHERFKVKTKIKEDILYQVKHWR